MTPAVASALQSPANEHWRQNTHHYRDRPMQYHSIALSFQLSGLTTESNPRTLVFKADLKASLWLYNASLSSLNLCNSQVMDLNAQELIRNLLRLRSSAEEILANSDSPTQFPRSFSLQPRLSLDIVIPDHISTPEPKDIEAQVPKILDHKALSNIMNDSQAAAFAQEPAAETASHDTSMVPQEPQTQPTQAEGNDPENPGMDDAQAPTISLPPETCSLHNESPVEHSREDADDASSEEGV